MANETDPLLPVAAIARDYGVAPSTVSRWATRGVLDTTGERLHLQTLRVGGRLRIRRSWADRFMAELNQSPTDIDDIEPVMADTADAELHALLS